ncbi:MAG TPA: arylesterase [Casimicrobiaceae bacterium]|nr:arylesterase [Casimicrobiaceae bacterium]
MLFRLWFASLCFVATFSHAAPAPTIVVVGDSISAGYGLAPGEVWVNLLERRIKQEGYPHRVVNASITGDTTAGGRARLPQLLKEQKPAIVVIELGGNDALRGQSLAGTRANLDAMVNAAQSAGAKVLIAGMRIPPNYGPMYVNEFNKLFIDIAKSRKTAFVPYLFEGFGEDLAMFQSDQIHPTSQAQQRMLETVWPALQTLLGAPVK